MLPAVGAAKDQSPSDYTKAEIDAKITELRSLIDQRNRDIQHHVDAFENGEKVNEYLGPISAAIISAVVLLILAFYAHRKEKRQADREKDRKQIESTLEFSRRFGELLQLQSKLNKEYVAAQANQQTPTNQPTLQEADEARIWWWLFFDLLLYEYDFFKQGLIWDERFAEWIKWRWYDFRATGDARWMTCGVDYCAGWQSWKDKPANHNNRLIAFLDKVHNRARDAAEVEQIVTEEMHSSKKKYHLIR